MTPAPKVNISPFKGWSVQKPTPQFSRVTGQQMSAKKVPQINKPIKYPNTSKGAGSKAKQAIKNATTPKGKKPLTKADILADSEGYQP